MPTEPTKPTEEAEEAEETEETELMEEEEPVGERVTGETGTGDAPRTERCEDLVVAAATSRCPAISIPHKNGAVIAAPSSPDVVAGVKVATCTRSSGTASSSKRN
jgi:hypothetical protein